MYRLKINWCKNVLYLPGSLFISNDSCRFSSYDMGLALSSSSESNATVGVGIALFFLPGVRELAFGLFGGAFGPVAALGPLTPVHEHTHSLDTHISSFTL